MAQNMVYHGGLTIRSAEKPAQQKAVEEIYANEKNFPKSIAKDKEDPQAAIFIMDYSGRVVATVGGRGEKTADRVLNRFHPVQAAARLLHETGVRLRPRYLL